MAARKIVLVEFPVFVGVVPLVSGYIEACCRKDPDIAASWEFEKISLPVKTPYEQVVSTLGRTDADVYAFSCYVWNIGLVRRVLKVLRAAKPDSHFLLGGPQVMHQATQYLRPDADNVYICNGEGERTSAAFLRALLSGNGDVASVRGLSFYREGTLVTTAPEPRISDMSEIPSPFLEGLFEQRYSWMLLETNRGCPFKCSYCYWGAATGAKVFKYDERRIERELEWISQSGCMYLFIADANWGMLKRDVDLSRYLVECQKRWGAPLNVRFCGSKNTPDRVAEITRIFHDAGMIATQSVALQTMSVDALKLVNRENIKTSAYIHIQQSMNAQSISSYVELIWPLPGETLDSFRRGLGQLCENGADSFMVYPLLLMNNVELAKKRDEYGLVTAKDPDPDSEAEVVVETAEVNRTAYDEGIRYIYAVCALYTLRGLWYLGRYLTRKGTTRYEQLFRAFVDYAKEHPQHPWTKFCERSISGLELGTLDNFGELTHLTLHSERDAFDDLLRDFVVHQDFWDDPVARCLFEIDIVNRPYVYRNTPIRPKPFRFEHLGVVPISNTGYLIHLLPQFPANIREHLPFDGDASSATAFEVHHRRAQLPLMSRKSPHENYFYCLDMMQRMGALLPLWSPVRDAVWSLGA